MKTQNTKNRLLSFTVIWLVLLFLTQLFVVPAMGQVVNENGLFDNNKQARKTAKLIGNMQKNAPIVVTFKQGVYTNYEQLLKEAGLPFSNYQSVVSTANTKLYPIVTQLQAGVSTTAALENLNDYEAQQLRTITLNAPEHCLTYINSLPAVESAFTDEVCTIYEPTITNIDFSTEPLVKGGLQYHFFSNKFDQAYQYLQSVGYEPQGSKVGVIDTGIWSDHPDLQGSVAAAYVLVPNGQAGVDPNGHGTHVGGTIGMRKNGTGGIGCAYELQLVSAQALNEGGAGFGTWINEAVFTLINEGVDVISMSLGAWSEPLSTPAIEAAEAANVSICIATGNSGIPVPERAAANNSTVLAVAAHDADFKRANFSNYNDACVYAAGVKVLAPHNSNPALYVNKSGTSMSTPVASSALVLIIDFAKWWSNTYEKEVILTSGQVEDFVRLSCDTVENVNGQVRAVNAYKAIKLCEDYLKNNYLLPPNNTPTFIPANPIYLSIQKDGEGKTAVQYNDGDYQHLFACNSFLDAFTTYNAAYNASIEVSIDTVHHIIEVQKIKGLDSEQKVNGLSYEQNIQINKLILLDIQGLEGTQDDAAAFIQNFGYCNEIAIVINALENALAMNLETWDARRIRRVKWVIWGFKLGYALIKCPAAVERPISHSAQQKADDLINQILTF